LSGRLQFTYTVRFFTDLGWTNTYKRMIVQPVLHGPARGLEPDHVNKTVPFDLEEAAMINGCNK
jgi:ABC-type glycerol-3-phosphate transport system permease component